MEELDLKEIFYMFWTKKLHIVIIVLVFMLVGILYTFLYVTPEYKSYTTLVLAKATEDAGTNASGTITSSDISLNNNLVNTYSELIRSKTVVRQVIDNLGIDENENALKKNISVSSVKSTQVIQIDVVNIDPYQAKIIANEVAKVFSEQVSEIYKINNVHIVDEAEEALVPYNINHMKDIAIFAFIGLVVACGYVLVANMLDTTVKSKEDVERKLGLTVLVSIPACNFDDATKQVKKGGRK